MAILIFGILTRRAIWLRVYWVWVICPSRHTVWVFLEEPLVLFQFAVKTINLRKLCDSDDLAGIKREIEIMSSLHHPNIIHIREVLENKEAIIIVMECAVGGELFQHLHRVKLLSESEARRIFRQTVSAIYYCHSVSIAQQQSSSWPKANFLRESCKIRLTMVSCKLLGSQCNPC